MKDKEEKKISNWVIIIPFITLIIILVGSVLVMIFLDKISERTEQPECKEICYSKNEIYYKNKAGFLENSICYCKDNTGGINTYLY